MNKKAYTIGMYEKAVPQILTWKEKLTAAKDAGYDFVEISIDETDDRLARLEMTREERLELIVIMYEVGIPIRSMCLSGHRRYPMGSHNPKLAEKSMEIMEKAISLADDLGVRIIMLAGYDVYYEDSDAETKRRFLENIKRATLMAAKAGILLSFETMETEFMNTVWKSMKYVKEVDSPYLKVYPDAGNITNAASAYRENVLEDLGSGRGYLVALHLKETVPGKFRNLMYGEGCVDFGKLIHQAWKLGVRRYVAEFWYLGSKDWRQELQFAHDTMCAFLDKEEERNI